ncbi:cytochrome c oxidase assembly protein COX20, mitochondrial-like [Nilaparvata lugens]|nr:cytochrome c oxidase assembly protein COX20, mitochondrial-like [Nilaparvata lugens]
MFFGRDVSKIPCFRNSFLYGLTSGLFGGLGYFMFTSKIPQSYRFGATTYLAVTIGYWLQCRYAYITNKQEIDRIQAALLRRIEIEGTALEAELLNDDDEDS